MQNPICNIYNFICNICGQSRTAIRHYQARRDTPPETATHRYQGGQVRCDASHRMALQVHRRNHGLHVCVVCGGGSVKVWGECQ